jgi:hypothetical protein
MRSKISQKLAKNGYRERPYYYRGQKSCKIPNVISPVNNVEFPTEGRMWYGSWADLGSVMMAVVIKEEKSGTPNRGRDDEYIVPEGCAAE